MYLSRSITSTLIVLVLLAAPVTASQPPGEAYRLGVVPYLSTLRLEAAYAPIAAELASEIDHPVDFRTASRFGIFRDNLESGTYDLAIIPPVLYPVAVERFGYLPLLRVREPLFAMIMVIEDGPIRRLEDLKGKLIMAPPVNGPVVGAAKRRLAEIGIDPATEVRFEHSKTHSSCLQQVLLKNVDACLAPDFAQAAFEDSMHARLRVLLRTEAGPSRFLVAHATLPDPIRERIRQVILSWSNTETGNKLFAGIKTRGFVDIGAGGLDPLGTE
ncbi:MAG: phosphate/phosphite/phosphonate ABC transporter substrate-binding protein [Gammaproteobacteria bacterium]|nr:phosphate/phosphite/phosphonate ABC transporter substrate-binding protein [Gammaproteobacteria bacterium]